MVCGWMAWSGLLVLVVKCVGKFSLPGSGLIICCTIMAGFGIHRENEVLVDVLVYNACAQV